MTLHLSHGIAASVRTLIVGVCLLGAAPSAATAQEADAARTRWVYKGELTTLFAQGNSESLTLGLGSVIRRRWEKDKVRFEAGAIRVETGKISRRAVGTEDAFAVSRDVARDKTAEAFFIRGRYDRTVSDDVFLFGGVDWLRNTFAGIDSRFLVAAGGGNSFADSESTRFSTTYAATYTFQSDVVKNPFLDADFVGARLGWELWRRISDHASYESTFVGDLNLKETDDRRFDMNHALTVDINGMLALKPSLQILWRNLPSLTDVPLYNPDGSPTGTTVETPLQKVDTFFRLALVVTF